MKFKDSKLCTGNCKQNKYNTYLILIEVQHHKIVRMENAEIFPIAVSINCMLKPYNCCPDYDITIILYVHNIIMSTYYVQYSIYKLLS